MGKEIFSFRPKIENITLFKELVSECQLLLDITIGEVFRKDIHYYKTQKD